ncbi:hypothetical protein [Kocuria marina]|uniref:hypothetical protein n=1 Tax=Kocuria marina TaxID=223184 RepID=UPI0022E5B875|nr:hypothetical protein [Kocuria marina]
MTQQPENPDPIASAGQIDDPDQPTTVQGHDDSRAGRDTQPDESSADGDPDQPGAVRRTTVAPAGTTDSTTVGGASNATDRGVVAGERTVRDDRDVVRDDHASDDSKPPKALKETGFPNVGEGTVDEQSAREVDSEALAETRKFQPRSGDPNPNISANPADRPDVDGEVFDEGNAQYQRSEEMPDIEPVRHSHMVEERVQEQERDYDLETTEDGERYLTPKDLPNN